MCEGRTDGRHSCELVGEDVREEVVLRDASTSKKAIYLKVEI